MPDDDYWVLQEEECVNILPLSPLRRYLTGETKKRSSHEAGYPERAYGETEDDLAIMSGTSDAFLVSCEQVLDLPSTIEYQLHIKTLSNLPSTLRSGQRVVVRMELCYGEEVLSRGMETSSVFVDQSNGAMYV